MPSTTDDLSASGHRRSRRRWGRLMLLAIVLMVIAAVVQIAAGSYDTSWADALRALGDPAIWSHPATLLRFILGDSAADALHLSPAVPLDTSTLIIWNVRLPRVLVALMVGMNLSMSGSIFQGITRNELASPYLLGVSSGAGLAILLVLVLFPTLGPHLPLLATGGGIAAFLLVYAIAWNHGTSSVRLVLAGVIVAAIAGSIQTGLFLLVRDLGSVQDIISWTVGSLTGVGWQQVRMAAPWTLVVVVLGLAGTRHLDVLLLGDATAKSLGMAVERTRFFLAAVAILAASTTISVAGLIGFVGLIVPHIVRTASDSSSRTLLIGCLVVGPALMLSADTAARLAFNPVQIPVGIVTGVFGGVYFLYLMRRNKQLVRP